MTSGAANAKTGHLAVVGMACRVPGASNPEEFWRNLCEGRESIVFPGDEELKAAGVPGERLRHRDFVRAAAPLEGADSFDASFFYLSAREAERMDPQLRLFLEAAWEAIERSGHNSERFDGSIGVFASSLMSTYLLANVLTSESHHAGDLEALLGDLAARMGNDSNYLATRTSYHLNLTGPSISVQTACSSSLVAVHTACQSLLAGECDMALAGGVSLRFPQLSGHLHLKDGILTRDGHVRPFDADASGTLFGNGLGVVVLRRLEDALRDGDAIECVILASAVNNDGSAKVGYAAPGVDGQARAVAEAVALAGVDPGTIGYVEAHGTGTPMGDPIEVAALSQVFRRPHPGCLLGSVKANIGHMSVAAGVVGLIKAALMLKHRRVPPSLNFVRPNPVCNFEETPFRVPTRLEEWSPAGDHPLRAGVSSFGMGGTNAHVVLEEPPDAAGVARPGRPSRLFVLSAKSPAALESAKRAAVAWLRSNPGADFGDACYTFATGRRTFNYRAAVVAADAESAAHALDTNDPAAVASDSGQPARRPVVFMFPGQGAQHPGMGLGPYRHERVFREALDACAEILGPFLGRNLLEVLHPASAGPEAASLLQQTRYAQPALFAVEYAMARQWMAWGIRPEALIGHSVGEYVAACLAGVFGLEDALRVVAGRGRLVQELPGGSMAAVPLPAARLAGRMRGTLSIAAENEPSACTVAGSAAEVQALVADLSAEGVVSRPLQTSHAFHSPMMDPAREALRSLLEGVTLRAPAIPFVSNLTGTWITAEQAVDPAYWADHLRNTVRFSDGAATLLAGADRIFLEAGPGQTLASFVRRHPDKESGHLVIASAGRAKGPAQEYASLLSAAGRLWLAGQELDWGGIFSGEVRHRATLPTYPFERVRYWADGHPSRLASRPARAVKLPVDAWLNAPVWKQRMARPGEADLPSGGSWLLFADNLGVGDRLAAALHAAGLPVRVAASAAAFADLGGGRYAVRPDSREDLQALVRALLAEGPFPDRLVHLGSVTGGSAEAPAGRDGFEAHQETGLYSLIALAQALAAERVVGNIRLDVFADRMHRVIGTERIEPAKSTLGTAAKVISQEYPHIRCQAVDLDTVGAGLAAAAEAALAVLAADFRPETGLAARGGRLWTQTFERLPQATDWESQAFLRIRQGGAYLLTGGTGEIGLFLAETLAKTHGARVALLSRESLPPRSEWEALADASAEPTAVPYRLARLLALEAAGYRPVLVTADAADEASLAAAVAEARETMGGLHGVFHLAGFPAEKWDRTIRDATPETCGWHFRPKVHGLLALEKAVRGLDLDFCFLFSSLAGILGGLRLLPYGAANEYMNAFALALEGRSRTRWVSAAWDVWQHHQDEKRAKSAIGRGMDDKTVLPEQGWEAILRLLAARGTPVAAVSTWDMGLRMTQWVAMAGLREEGAAAARSAEAGEGGSEGAEDAPVLSAVLSLLHKALGRDELGPDGDFFESGGDSLVSVQILSQIREKYQVDVSLARFLNEPTARRLAGMVEEARGAAGREEELRSALEAYGREELLRMIQEVESMSGEDLEKALAEEAA